MRVGCDEAGKGPVLGSMFAAAVSVPDPSVLPASVDDSKQLAAETRSTVATQIHRHPEITTGVAEITVGQIDAPTTDMNSLTVQAHAKAISKALPADAPAESVLVDAADPDADRFARRVAETCPLSVSVTGRHEADATDPVVGAASILAKVHRDDHIDQLTGEYGAIGSGYPSDPTTRQFLADYLAAHGTLPAIARRSWQTCQDLLATAEQANLDEF